MVEELAVVSERKRFFLFFCFPFPFVFLWIPLRPFAFTIVITIATFFPSARSDHVLHPLTQRNLP